MRQVFIFVAALIATSLSLAPPARSSPAVSTPNGKVEAGWFGQGSLGTPYLTGSYDVPLGEHFGFQADALAGHVQGDSDYWGLGGQFFWRDPEIALIGIGVSRLEYGGFRIERLQANTELYLGDFTVSAQAARDFYNFSGLGLGNSDSADVSVGWYPNANLLLQLGGSFGLFGNSATIHTEWQPDVGVSGLALTADLSRGSGETGVLFAVRYYFGGDDKTLKRRHREDDPPIDFAPVTDKDFRTVTMIQRALVARETIAAAKKGKRSFVTTTYIGQERAWALARAGVLDTVISNCRKGIANEFPSAYDFRSTVERQDNIQVCAAVVDLPTFAKICDEELLYTAAGDDEFMLRNRQTLGFCRYWIEIRT